MSSNTERYLCILRIFATSFDLREAKFDPGNLISVLIQILWVPERNQWDMYILVVTYFVLKKEPFCNHVRKRFMKISVIINYFLCFICKEKPLRMGIPVAITYVMLFFAIVYQIVTLAKCWGVFSVFKACTIQRRIQNMKNVYNGVFGENN